MSLFGTGNGGARNRLVDAQRYLKSGDYKGPFGAHDMIEIGYDMKLDKDRK